jgi:hypothetical protein
MFAGWSVNSDMPRRYIHLFGNAACEDLLQAYGFVDKEKQAFNSLQRELGEIKRFRASLIHS